MTARYIDVFNGDADGICALVQLHLAQPREATLVTGIKRDIALLKKVQAQKGDRVTVLDVSLDKNRVALQEILQKGAQVFYADHHHPGEIPSHPQLETRIDTAPDTCTSLLIHEYLGGLYPAWAMTGAFGDNLHARARQLGQASGCGEEEIGRLEELGTCINYNAYGSSEEDLHVRPRELFEELRNYDDPLLFLENNAPLFARLREGYRQDMEHAEHSEPLRSEPRSSAYLLPDAPWARRVGGVFGNLLARQQPERAHAILWPQGKEDYVVSVRAPRKGGPSAQQLCSAFPSGGGRAGAAGINQLPQARLEEFLESFARYYAEPAGAADGAKADAVSASRRSSSKRTK